MNISRNNEELRTSKILKGIMYSAKDIVSDGKNAFVMAALGLKNGVKDRGEDVKKAVDDALKNYAFVFIVECGADQDTAVNVRGQLKEFFRKTFAISKPPVYILKLKKSNIKEMSTMGLKNEGNDNEMYIVFAPIEFGIGFINK